MADPWQWWSAERIAEVTQCPVANVRENWPLICDALDAQGIYDRDVAMGVISTVSIETASTFQPVKEAYWLPDSYRATLEYAPFWGRGFDQTTWEAGYREVGQFLGRDLLVNPDLLLRADLSARVIAWRFAKKGVPSKDGTRSWTFAQLCRDHDWEWVRRGIQGGTNGLDRLIAITAALGGAPVVIPFNPDAPIDVQPNDWSCSLQSTQWLLRSIGRNPDAGDPVNDPWMTSQLVPGIISPDVGLRNASGKELCAWLNREYGAEMGFVAGYGDVTFDDVAAGAGSNPTIVGGRQYGPGGHWVGIRRLLPDGTLELANPAPNYTNTGASLDRAEWDARGPWSGIWIDRLATGEQPAPPPVVVPPAPPTLDRAAVAEKIRAIMALATANYESEHREWATLLQMVEPAA